MTRDDIWRERLDLTIAQFHRREISDDMFRACLLIAGFKGVRLNEEFNYQDSLRIRANFSQ